MVFYLRTLGHGDRRIDLRKLLAVSVNSSPQYWSSVKWTGGNHDFYVFLRAVNEHTNQEPTSRKSFLRRFLKKMNNSRFLGFFCLDNFSGWFDLFFDSIMLILIKF